MRISDWSSDVCSSDLHLVGEVIVELAEQRKGARVHARGDRLQRADGLQVGGVPERALLAEFMIAVVERAHHPVEHLGRPVEPQFLAELIRRVEALRSEEHTSELQSLMRISYAVFCLK